LSYSGKKPNKKMCLGLNLKGFLKSNQIVVRIVFFSCLTVLMRDISGQAHVYTSTLKNGIKSILAKIVSQNLLKQSSIIGGLLNRHQCQTLIILARKRRK
jgi:hypothetical protein